ncbi:serine/threonine protein kinase [Crateriforma conspicua]|uniref:Serine/threonine-protein kinase PknD n=1 Tax=Crateriforma conspicua TaxID=2527996 RepID=A0A5C5Y739_9PLAN|nr:serine/threonine-protein kinase [Crateriforma conspicua]TWT70769.1 Serine/threonine-protein kinase PknD [Crateriforma conspicua]
MNVPSENDDESRQQVIDELLDVWEEAQENGTDLSVEELCRSHPDLIAEVRDKIARLAEIDGRIGQGMPMSDWSDATLPVRTTIEELEFLQRGGLGAVYVGEDMTAHRRVAVKFLHKHLVADEVCRERFLLEAEVTARLEHPGVIPLYGVGRTTDGDPFYAMRFIDGQSMDDLIASLHSRDDESKTNPLETDRRYRLLLNHFVSVCKTVAYAHNRGIVHRDIKPANVMLGKYGETIVVDWGLAIPVVRDEPFRQSGENTLMPVQSGDSSTSGLGAGTPVYMSPEQASKLAPTPASDIYSLGATLYKILCGTTPVDGESVVEIKEKVIDGRIRPVKDVRGAVPAALAAIAHKAMSLQPADRYPTALKMAEDVEAFLADDPVSAHRETWFGRLFRLARRHRVATQIALIALVLFGVFSAFAFLTLGAYATRETFARKDAEAAERLADEARNNAEQSRNNAEQSRRASLGASAQFLAQSIGNQIDLRWRILESEASSGVLRDLVVELNRKIETASPDSERGAGAVVLQDLAPEQPELQNWLQDRFIEHQNAVKTESWYVQSVQGIQIARVKREPSIGRSYRHRDYFHGLGYDLTPEEARNVGPLAGRIVHMCAAYKSTNSHTLKVAFAVPIYDGPAEQTDRRRIGVIGMAVELGDFAMRDNTWLVDTRVDQYQKRRGLLLQHPELGLQNEDDPPRYMEDAWVQQALRGRRIRMRDLDRGNSHDQEVMVTEVADPIDGRPRVVATEPVIIHGRPDDVADTGWIVVVSDQG